MLAISAFENKKVFFFILVTGGQSDRGQRDREQNDQGAK
jgi:hypothetical protein